VEDVGSHNNPITLHGQVVGAIVQGGGGGGGGSFFFSFFFLGRVCIGWGFFDHFFVVFWGDGAGRCASFFPLCGSGSTIGKDSSSQHSFAAGGAPPTTAAGWQRMSRRVTGDSRSRSGRRLQSLGREGAPAKAAYISGRRGHSLMPSPRRSVPSTSRRTSCRSAPNGLALVANAPTCRQSYSSTLARGAVKRSGRRGHGRERLCELMTPPST